MGMGRRYKLFPRAQFRCLFESARNRIIIGRGLELTVEITRPELERFVREEIRSGHFRSIDDLLAEAFEALREKHAAATGASPSRKNLAQFLLESPFAGSDLEIERRQDYGRPIDL